MNIINNWRLWLPILSGYIMVYLCKFKNESIVIPQKPPSIIFKLIWPILYILLGISWNSVKPQSINDIMHSLCNILLVLWLFVYNCKNKKKYGIYILASIIGIVTAIISIHSNALHKLYLIPLLSWLLIAYQLNWDIIK